MAEIIPALNHPVIRAFLGVLRAGARQEVSGREMLRRTRAQGGAIRDATFFDAYRELRQQNAMAYRLQFLGRNARPNPANLPISPSLIDTNYAFTVGIHPITSDRFPKFESYISLKTNDILLRHELEALAFEISLQYEGLSRFTADDFRLLSGRRAAFVTT